jgi:hypothetical protein
MFLRLECQPLNLTAHNIGTDIQLIESFANTYHERSVDSSGPHSSAEGIGHLRVS